MTLSYNETKELINLILETPHNEARDKLFESLNRRNKTVPEFYAGIIEHKVGLKLSSNQWFELLSRLPNRVLYSSLDIGNLLSTEQLKKLKLKSRK